MENNKGDPSGREESKHKEPTLGHMIDTMDTEAPQVNQGFPLNA